MLKIKKANLECDWLVAAQLLHRVIAHLNEIGCPLWAAQQVSIEGLKSFYKIDELYFILDFSDSVVGVVFLQDYDPYFWPEVQLLDSLFVHKLALDPLYQGKDYGRDIIQLIVAEAERRRLQWVRLDCDDRQPLHLFYQLNGFKLVDVKPMQQFMVARYELPTSHCITTDDGKN